MIANTNGLSVGSHSATLHFHSANGDMQTAVKIHVVSNGQSAQQAILNVSPQKLDLQQAGQQVQQSISIANLGNIPLQWQANLDAGSANWLTLATTKGTIQSGAVPQTVLRTLIRQDWLQVVIPLQSMSHQMVEMRR